MADSFIVSLPSRLFICIRVNRKKYKSCYDDVLESLQGCRRFKEKMYKNWMNGVQNASEGCTSLLLWNNNKKDSDARIRVSLS